MSYGRLFYDDKVAIQLGGNFFDEDADVFRFSNDGWQAFAGVVVRPIRNASVYGRAGVRSRDFEGGNAAIVDAGGAEVRRDERDYRYVVGGSYTLSGTGVELLDDWRIDVFWSRTDSQSNISLFEFDRDEFGFTAGRSF